MFHGLNKQISASAGDRLLTSRWQTSARSFPCGYDTEIILCLLAGVPLERVSILLGHSTIIVTERHYPPPIQKRQQQLEADLPAMW